jgi:arylsulfatase
MKTIFNSSAIIFASLFFATIQVSAQEVLPFPSPPMGGTVGPTLQESVHKWREQPSPLPEDAPNILIVMLDDAYFDKAPFAFEGTLKQLHFKNLQDERPAFQRSPDDD